MCGLDDRNDRWEMLAGDVVTPAIAAKEESCGQAYNTRSQDTPQGARPLLF